ncbi:MAG TPA: hypothetical protein VKL40_09280 [Candidatus Angelobacter sp.]|nr:hypothetical protein [Candidatus Angelobacter sp.]
MKPLRVNSPLVVGLLAVFLLSGCEKKKPVSPSPQVQAPAPAEATPAGEETQQAQAPRPPVQGTPPPDPGQVQTPEEKAGAQPETPPTDEDASKTKAKPGRSSNTKKAPSPSTTARNSPPKIVVKPDGAGPSATPGLISPSPPSGDVSHDQANTEQLLQSSESNLNNIKRQLSSDEQAIVTQIRDYMSQSRQAIKDNDLVRARNLALKAHLLSDDLAKRR